MDLLDQLRTVAWYHSIAGKLGVNSAYAVSQAIADLRVEMEDGLNADIKSFGGYAKGEVVPVHSTVQMVERLLPETASIFEIGPRSESGNFVPLWLALAGNEQALRGVLVNFDPMLGMYQAFGVTMQQFVHKVMDDIWSEDSVMENFDAGFGDPSKNTFAIEIDRGTLKISLEQMTAIIALWNLTMNQQTYYQYLYYFVTGLRKKAVTDLVEHYGIATLLGQYLEHISNHHWAYLKKLASGTLGDDDFPTIRFVS